MEEEERTEELIEKDQLANYTKIQEEVKVQEKEMKEAEEVVAKEEAEVKELQTKITACNALPRVSYRGTAYTTSLVG